MLNWRIGVAVSLLSVVGLGACSRATKAPPAAPVAQPQPQQDRPTSTPYSGDLSIFESPGRDKRLQIDRVMKLLKLGPGKTVADIGAGSGWFSVRAAKKVAPGGTVFAEDINPAATKYIDDRAKKESLPNIRTVLGVPDDPKLPAASVDAVLMLKVYHEIAQPVRFVENLKPSLKPGALVGIIDRNGNGSGTDHGIPQAVVEREMGEAGYRRVAVYDFTKGDGQDYFLIFTPVAQ
jgi:ubiquinone/menaquinone biosynthesis C-methylase UbiE